MASSLLRVLDRAVWESRRYDHDPPPLAAGDPPLAKGAEPCMGVGWRQDAPS